MHHIKAEYFGFHIVYVTQLFFFVRYDSYCNVSTHMTGTVNTNHPLSAVQFVFLAG